MTSGHELVSRFSRGWLVSVQPPLNFFPSCHTEYARSLFANQDCCGIVFRLPGNGFRGCSWYSPPGIFCRNSRPKHLFLHSYSSRLFALSPSSPSWPELRLSFRITVPFSHHSLFSRQTNPYGVGTPITRNITPTALSRLPLPSPPSNRILKIRIISRQCLPSQ
jgi:hypothetical protein